MSEDAPAGIRSFSGAHPYRPQCVIDACSHDFPGADYSKWRTDIAVGITRKLDGGTCPRCDSVLDLKVTAGSRITRCRCVPICPTCGDDEGRQASFGTGVSQAWRWPVRKGDITRRRNKWLKQVTPAVMELGGDDQVPVVLSDDGVTPVRTRPFPGGWAEFGYDDTPDQGERER